MSQGKLEVVKQEMARVNINILGISELKWTRMGEFNLGGHYIYYCGQESLRRNGVAITVNKSPTCSTWVQSQKWQNDLHSFPRQTIQYYSNSSLCHNYWCWRSWSWTILWRPTRPSRTNTKKDVLFITGDWNVKIGSQDTWSNMQVWPWSTKWIRKKANSFVRRSHSKGPFPTTQETMLRMDITILFFADKNGEALYSQQK